MERDEVQRLSFRLHLCPESAVGDDAVRLGSDNLRHPMDGRSGSDDLRIIVPHTAHIDIGMAVTGGQFRPMLHQVFLLQGKFITCSGIIDGPGFAPDAHVGVLFLDPFDEGIVMVNLSRPHSILDVPEQETERLPGRSPGTFRSAGHRQQDDRQQQILSHRMETFRIRQFCASQMYRVLSS